MKFPKRVIVSSVFMLLLLGSAMLWGASGITNREPLVGANVRALGMGSAFTAGPSSSDGLFWNPSLVGFLEGAELSLVGLPFSDDADMRDGAFSLAFNPYALGVANRNIGNFSVSSWFDGFRGDGEKNRMMLLGYGLPLGSKFAAGTNLRHHRWSSDARTQLGWSFDIGVLYSLELNRLGDRVSVGLSFEDLGGHVWKDGLLVEKMVPVTRLGSSYSLDANTIISGDVVLRNDKQFSWEERFRTHIGAERWLFSQRLGLRMGYSAIANYDRFTEGEWSRGLSLQNEAGRIDYAYISGGELEAGVHWIAATLHWGGEGARERGSEEARERGSEGTGERGSYGDSTVLLSEARERGGEGASSVPSVSSVGKEVPEVRNPKTQTSTTPAPILMPDVHPLVLTVSEMVISPNEDGIKDETVIAFEPPVNGGWRLEIRDAYTEIVRQYTHTDSAQRPIKWDGSNANGERVSDGEYTAALFRVDAQGKQRAQSQATLVVDTMPTELRVSAEPPVLAASDAEPVIVSIPQVHVQRNDYSGIARWQLEFFDGDGKSIDTMQGEAEPPSVISWTNWEKYQHLKDYRCALTVHDMGGNTSTTTTTFSRVDLGGTPTPPTPPTEKTETVAQRKDERGLVLTLAGLAFASNSYEIKPEYRSALEQAAKAIAAQADAKVVIEGHTDDIGEAGYNLDLSRKRANAVMAYLVDNLGISPARLTAIGYGEARPLVPNTTPSNQKKNRRVEIVLSTGNSATPSPEAIKGSGFTVLISSFKERRNAETLVEALEMLDLRERIRIAPVTVQSGLWYRVVVGQFPTREDALVLANKIKASQGIEPLVISEK